MPHPLSSPDCELPELPGGSLARVHAAKVVDTVSRDVEDAKSCIANNQLLSSSTFADAMCLSRVRISRISNPCVARPPGPRPPVQTSGSVKHM